MAVTKIVSDVPHRIVSSNEDIVVDFLLTMFRDEEWDGQAFYYLFVELNVYNDISGATSSEANSNGVTIPSTLEAEMQSVLEVLADEMVEAGFVATADFIDEKRDDVISYFTSYLQNKF